MFEKSHIPSREEAIEAGLPLYGQVSEVYTDVPAGPLKLRLPYGELLGTRIDMITVDSDKFVLGSFIRRIDYPSARSYERHVRKAIKQDAAAIHSHNRILAPKVIAS